MFEADAGYTRTRTPVLGSNATSGNDSYAVGGQISRTYPSGTTATIRAEGERFSSSRASSSAAFTNQLGKGYQASLRATVNQPLLQGYGATVNEAGWRAAKINEERARKAYLRTTSEALHDVLGAYWELWYAGRAIEILRRGRWCRRLGARGHQQTQTDDELASEVHGSVFQSIRAK